MNYDHGTMVVVGRIRGPFGVKGEVRVEDYSRQKGDILHYNPWVLRLEEAVADALVDRIYDLPILVGPQKKPDRRACIHQVEDRFQQHQKTHPYQNRQQVWQD